MRTEQEFEQYVAELGRKGVAKRRKRQRMLVTAASVLVVCIVSVLAIRTIRDEHLTSKGEANFGFAADKDANSVKPGSVITPEGVEENAVSDWNAAGKPELATGTDSVQVTETSYILEIIRDGIATGIFLSEDQYKDLMDWYDTASDHAQELANTNDTIADSYNSNHIALIKNNIEVFVYLGDGYLMMDQIAYEVPTEDKDALSDILRFIQ